MKLQEILTLLTILFGSTSIFQGFLLWKTRNSEIKKAEATTLEAIDNIYKMMTDATEKKFKEMQTIIDKQETQIVSANIKITELQQQLKQYSENCSNCTNEKKAIK